MNAATAVNELAGRQRRLLALVQDAAGDGYRRQYHPDLSPLGWHLGHCVYTENYWIREVVLGEETIAPEIKRLYVPELSAKTRRGGALPRRANLCRQAEQSQAQNRRHLLTLTAETPPHELLEGLFLIHFLSRHYGQHIETCLYALRQMVLETLERAAPEYAPKPLQPTPVRLETAAVEAGEYPVGCRDDSAVHAYDNEQPGFTCFLEGFRISKTAVANGQYLEFMLDGGYEDRALWDEPGRRWRQATGCAHPHHWRQDRNGDWYGVGLHGAHALDGAGALSGISHFEARAFAAWCGARLPHEYEWETAQKSGLLQQTGECWEWCANEFHPYRGFRPYPYEGYSVPYFNNGHYTLRGGSRYTAPGMNGTTFRNYYQPDKRHINAGLRLVAA